MRGLTDPNSVLRLACENRTEETLDRYCCGRGAHRDWTAARSDHYRGRGAALDQVSGGTIDPSQKATHLASGINASMTATAVGIGVGSLGMVVVLVSLVMLLSAKPPAERAP